MLLQPKTHTCFKGGPHKKNSQAIVGPPTFDKFKAERREAKMPSNPKNKMSGHDHSCEFEIERLLLELQEQAA